MEDGSGTFTYGKVVGRQANDDMPPLMTRKRAEDAAGRQARHVEEAEQLVVEWRNEEQRALP